MEALSEEEKIFLLAISEEKFTPENIEEVSLSFSILLQRLMLDVPGLIVPENMQICRLITYALSVMLNERVYRNIIYPTRETVCTFILQVYDLAGRDREIFFNVLSCIRYLTTDCPIYHEPLLKESILISCFHHLDVFRTNTYENNHLLLLMIFLYTSYLPATCAVIDEVNFQLVMLRYSAYCLHYDIDFCSPIDSYGSIIPDDSIKTVKLIHVEVDQFYLILNIFFNYLRDCKGRIEELVRRARLIHSSDSSTSNSCTSCILGRQLKHALMNVDTSENDYETFMKSVCSVLSLIPKCGVSKIIPSLGKDSNGLDYDRRPKVFDGKLGLLNRFMHHDVRVVSIILQCLYQQIEKPLKGYTDKIYVVTVLLGLNLSCLKNKVLRKYLRQVVLPPIKKVIKSIESEPTFRGYISRLIRDIDSDLSELSGEFLFNLCRRKLGRFLKHVGFLNIAGFLINCGILRHPEFAENEEATYRSNHLSDSTDCSENEEDKEAVDQMCKLQAVQPTATRESQPANISVAPSYLTKEVEEKFRRMGLF